MSSAGHPPAIRVSRNGHAQIVESDGGLPLGMLEEPMPFQSTTIRLEPGDRLILYTDGIVEWRNAIGDQFGAERLLRCLAEPHRRTLQALLSGAVNNAQGFAGTIPCGDDLSLMGLEYLGPAAN